MIIIIMLDWQILTRIWQKLCGGSGTCLHMDKPRLCTHNAWLARPVRIHHKAVCRALLDVQLRCHGYPLGCGHEDWGFWLTEDVPTLSVSAKGKTHCNVLLSHSFPAQL